MGRLVECRLVEDELVAVIEPEQLAQEDDHWQRHQHARLDRRGGHANDREVAGDGGCKQVGGDEAAPVDRITLVSAGGYEPLDVRDPERPRRDLVRRVLATAATTGVANT